MSTSQLFIPTKIKVGFVHRDDTFLKTLSYIIYFDTKGILRKETSWNNWRDKSIEPIEVDNVPHSGFILNKDIQRFNWYHYSKGRSMIRIYDDRGMEFEITPTNLLFILMNTNCFKRELESEFVYAWDNKDLVLLPTCCEEYKASTTFTELQGGKITATNMVPGCVYKTKKNENVIYLGKFTWFDSSYRRKTEYFSEKRYIFIKEGGKKEYGDKLLGDCILFTTTTLDKIALKITDSHVENFVERLEQLSKSKYCSKPIKLITQKLNKEIISNTWRIVGIEKEENLIKLYEIRKHQIWDSSIKEYTGFNYDITHKETLQLKNNKLTKNSDMDGISYGGNTRHWNYDYTYYTLQEVIDTFIDVKIELANGLQINYHDY